MLINTCLIIVYIFACIYCMCCVLKNGVRKNLFQVIFLLVIFFLNLYYYRPLNLEDIVGEDKYSELVGKNVEVVEEEHDDSSLEESNVLPSLRNIQIRRSPKDYDDKKINAKYKKSSYAIRNDQHNIIRITIYGDYEYIEHGGSLYKCIKKDK